MVTIKNKPKSTHKNERASIPLEGYFDVVSAISAKRTKWKASVPSVAVQVAYANHV